MGYGGVGEEDPTTLQNPDALVFPDDPDSPTYWEVWTSEKLRGCPFGAHDPGKPHHYSCWAWMG